jgi:phytoene dehydrogenase-like protein
VLLAVVSTMARASIAALLPLFALAPVHASSASDPNAPTAFAAISDWGGVGAEPYSTAAQKAVANALANVSAANGVQFVLSAGNNFLPSGLPRACCSSCPVCRRQH